MEYVKIAKVGDFKDVRVRSYSVMARKVGVFRERDGSFYAIDVMCKHANADLTTGVMKGDVATCPWHGWKYNLRTGECLWGAPVKLKPYGLKVEGDDIYITLKPLDDQPTDVPWDG